MIIMLVMATTVHLQFTSTFTCGDQVLFSAMATAEPPLKTSNPSSASREEFLGVYKIIRNEILDDPMISQADTKAWMARMMDYNVPGGKLNRGMSVKDTLLAIDANASPDLRFQADCLGWAVEFLQVVRPSAPPCCPLLAPQSARR